MPYYVVSVDLTRSPEVVGGVDGVGKSVVNTTNPEEAARLAQELDTIGFGYPLPVLGVLEVTREEAKAVTAAALTDIVDGVIQTEWL